MCKELWEGSSSYSVTGNGDKDDVLGLTVLIGDLKSRMTTGTRRRRPRPLSGLRLQRVL